MSTLLPPSDPPIELLPHSHPRSRSHSPSPPHSRSPSHPRPLPSLPPTDTGPRAWICLLGCFTANVLVWGFAFSFGVLQEHYLAHEPFASRPSGIPAIGTTATGLMYLLMPAYFWVFQRWPRTRRWSLYAGLPLAAAALVGASFAETVGGLVVTQGVIYAIAGNGLVTPTITYLDEWFVRRKGLAIGIMWAGDGTGGVLMPLILQPLLDRVGFRWTLRIIAGIIIVLTAPMLHFLQPRLPIPAVHTTRPVNVSFLRAPLFWAFLFTTVIQALGYFLPPNYLPTFARSLGLDSTIGSLTLLMVNLASIFGCVAVGALVDRFDVTAIILGISVCAGLAVLALWGCSTSVAPLLAFSLLYGLFASSFSTTWGGMIKDVQRHHEGADANMVFSFLAAGRGIGAVISGPLSEALLEGGKLLKSGTDSVYDSEYGSVIIFSGCTALVGGCSWFFRRCGLI